MHSGRFSPGANLLQKRGDPEVEASQHLPQDHSDEWAGHPFPVLPIPSLNFEGEVEDQKSFPVKDQVVEDLGFEGHVVRMPTTHSCGSIKVVMGKSRMRDCSCELRNRERLDLATQGLELANPDLH